MSASPRARMASAWSNVVMPPLVTTGLVGAAPVQAGEDRGHAVVMRGEQPDSTEPGAPRPPRPLREEPGQHPRQLADVGQVHIPDALPIAVIERLEIARREHRIGQRAVADEPG